jgi:hypothetical protein
MMQYRLSFTTGGLFVRESAIGAELLLDLGNREQALSALMESNALQQRTHKSKRTLSRETVDRLSMLDRSLLALLTLGSAEERGHIMWFAACRRYELVGEFAREVVREKYLMMTPSLMLEDFDSFVRSKALWHDELNSLAVSTLARLRQNTFKMLRDAELLSEAGRILPTTLTPRVADALAANDRSAFTYFPVTDSEIERMVG